MYTRMSARSVFVRVYGGGGGGGDGGWANKLVIREWQQQVTACFSSVVSLFAQGTLNYPATSHTNPNNATGITEDFTV